MRAGAAGFAAAAMLGCIAVAGCGKTESAAPETSVQSGIDRSVADVRAAEAAMAAPLAQSKSVAELTGKAVDAGPVADNGGAEAPGDRNETEGRG